jgi:peptidoglycan/LPS O-acetylase OafA/YrhL
MQRYATAVDIREAQQCPATATTRNSAIASEKRITELDGLRGLAILMVLIFHYAAYQAPTHSVIYYLLIPIGLMWSGVDLFFVLSGFLIGGILIDHKNSKKYFSVFYRRRIHRIFPVYYLMIAAFLAGRFLFPTSELFVSAMPAWAYLLFAQNLVGPFLMTFGSAWMGVTWSLAIEEQFYLLLPLIVRKLSGRGLLNVVVACIFGAPLLRAVLVLRGWQFEQLHPFFPCRADALGLGVLAAITVRSDAIKFWIRRHALFGYACWVALLGGMMTLLKFRTWMFNATIGYSIIGVFYFVSTMLVLLAPLPAVRRVLVWRWLRWLGTVSYCVYLIHQPIRSGLLLFFQRSGSLISGAHVFGLTLVALALTFLISQLSWAYLERPLMQRAHARYKY